MNRPRKSDTVISFRPAVNVPMCSKRVVSGSSYSSKGARLNVVEFSEATLPNMSQMKNVVTMRVASSGVRFLKRIVKVTSESREHSGTSMSSSKVMPRRKMAAYAAPSPMPHRSIMHGTQPMSVAWYWSLPTRKPSDANATSMTTQMTTLATVRPRPACS